MSSFKPMLAGTLDTAEIDAITYPVLASPKLDGFRAVVKGGYILSRNLLTFPSKEVNRLFSHEVLNSLDGELIVGNPTSATTFNATSRVVTAVNGIGDVKYHVFDTFIKPEAPFVQRLQIAKTLIYQAGIKQVGLVPHTMLKDVDQLRKYMMNRLHEGYEGVMVRKPHGHYKQGRSTLNEGLLLKLKPVVDSEALVLGCEEAMANTNEVGTGGRRRSMKSGLVPKGTLGRLLVRDIHDGREFALGTGTLKASEARKLWAERDTLPGRVAKYKYQKIGTIALPRQPIFLGWRDAVDMPV